MTTVAADPFFEPQSQRRLPRLMAQPEARQAELGLVRNRGFPVPWKHPAHDRLSRFARAWAPAQRKTRAGGDCQSGENSASSQRTAANSAPMPLNSSNILPAGAGAAGCGAASSASRSASASLI